MLPINKKSCIIKYRDARNFYLLIGRDPLPWAMRVQIALDSARGLEYVHEHTVPVYIHRDIKSANILIDKNYRAKVIIIILTEKPNLCVQC